MVQKWSKQIDLSIEEDQLTSQLNYQSLGQNNLVIMYMELATSIILL